jgi:hypothetical protein
MSRRTSHNRTQHQPAGQTRLMDCHSDHNHTQLRHSDRSGPAFSCAFVSANAPARAGEESLFDFSTRHTTESIVFFLFFANVRGNHSRAAQ